MELVQEYLIVKNGGTLLSEYPQSFGVQCQRQHDNTLYERKVKTSERRWSFCFILSAISVLLFNLTVLFFSVRGIKLQFPIGFIPLPFLIGTLYMKNKRSGQLAKLIRYREDREIDVLLNRELRG